MSWQIKCDKIAEYVFGEVIPLPYLTLPQGTLPKVFLILPRDEGNRQVNGETSGGVMAPQQTKPLKTMRNSRIEKNVKVFNKS